MRQLEEEESRELYPKQPFLICLGTLHQPTSYNLVVDNFVIPCGEKIEHAFKVLYCAFHAFHLVFPKKLNTFYKFFDGIIFQVNTKIIPTCLNLKTQLDAMIVPSLPTNEPSEESKSEST